jgi:hypothetical protein
MEGFPRSPKSHMLPHASVGHTRHTTNPGAEPLSFYPRLCWMSPSPRHWEHFLCITTFPILKDRWVLYNLVTRTVILSNSKINPNSQDDSGLFSSAARFTHVGLLQISGNALQDPQRNTVFTLGSQKGCAFSGCNITHTPRVLPTWAMLSATLHAPSRSQIWGTDSQGPRI